MIYVTGCSHTAGTVFSVPDKKDIYPERLKSEYGYDVQWYAKAGLSNDRIFRNAVENTVLRIAQGHEVPWEAVVVQWSSADRFETPTYSRDNEMYRRSRLFNGPGNLGPGDPIDHRPWSAVDRAKRTDVEFADFYKTFYSDLDYWNNSSEYTQDQVAQIHSVIKRLEKNLVTQVITLDRFMKYNGVGKVIHIFSNAFVKICDNDQEEAYKYMISRLDILTHPKIGLIDLLRHANYKTCQIKPDPSSDQIDGHFMADAHLRICDWVHDMIVGRINRPLQAADVREPDFLLGKEDELAVNIEDSGLQIFDYDV